jgi:hypothetical protein
MTFLADIPELACSARLLPKFCAVVDSNKWAFVADCVGYADGSGLGHLPRCLINREPGDLPCFIGRMGVSADDAAPEGKGHDASEHVLVDARELLGLDFDASLFQDFSGNAFRWCLGKFQHATWRDPAAVIGSLDGQDSPVVAKHDSGDSPRVRGSSVIAIPLLRCPFVGEPPLLAREHVSHGLDPYVVLRVGDAGACRIKGAGQEQSAERPVLTIAEVYALANAIDQRYRALVLLGTFASLRWAELAALRPGDIDLESCTIRVERPLIEQLGGGSAFGATQVQGRTTHRPIPRHSRS